MKVTYRPVLANPHARILARGSSVITTVDKRVQRLLQMSWLMGQVAPRMMILLRGVTYQYAILTFEHLELVKVVA